MSFVQRLDIVIVGLHYMPQLLTTCCMSFVQLDAIIGEASVHALVAQYLLRELCAKA